MDTEELNSLDDGALDKVEVLSAERISRAEQEVAKRFAKGSNDKYGRFFLAALSGVPWILPLSVIANFKGELDQDGMNAAFRLWLQEHQAKLKELSETINDILT